ncbi:uncharacterized protein LOC106661241 [Cimex lectularius]|uniref:Uncharacterized protein n=1 Tax=Cimex lectularius TaxID=79782 RepID=A0A8I6R757_CIMLE|nr:uncharacterized protein LOC106661241 [Cimex lectularius]
MPRQRNSVSVNEEPSDTRERLVNLILNRRREAQRNLHRLNPLEVALPNFELELLAAERREIQLISANGDTSGRRNAVGRINIPKNPTSQTSSLDEYGGKIINLYPLNPDGSFAEGFDESETSVTYERRPETARKTAIKKSHSSELKYSNNYNGGRYNSPSPQCAYNDYDSSDCDSYDSSFEEKHGCIPPININSRDAKKRKTDLEKFLGSQLAKEAAFNAAAKSAGAIKPREERVDIMDIWSKPFGWFTLPGEKMQKFK